LYTYTSEGDTRTGILEDFAARVYYASEGKMMIDVLAGTATGAEIYEYVSSGSAEMGSTPISYFGGSMPKNKAVLSPPWSHDTDECLKARKAVLGWEPAAAEAADKGIMFKLWLSSGYVDLCFEPVINAFEDVATNSPKIATGGSSVLEDMAIAIGATAEGSPNNQVITNAVGGIIQGAYIPVEDYVRYGLPQYFPNMVLTEFFPTLYSCIINVDAYDALDSDLQGIVDDCIAEVESDGIKIAKQEYATARAALFTNPDVNNVYDLALAANSADRDLWWEAMGQAMFDSTVSDLGSLEVLNTVEGIANDAMGVAEGEGVFAEFK
jgi:TRAP-type C4-dicarboxylate transport system substrate-binding protein